MGLGISVLGSFGLRVLGFEVWGGRVLGFCASGFRGSGFRGFRGQAVEARPGAGYHYGPLDLKGTLIYP